MTNPFFNEPEKKTEDEDLLAALAKADEVEDVSDIPTELVEKLELATVSPKTQQIIDIIARRKVASFANVCADMARAEGLACPARQTIQQRIYAAVKAGKVFPVDGRRGMYSIAPLSVREKEETPVITDAMIGGKE